MQEKFTQKGVEKTKDLDAGLAEEVTPVQEL